MAEQAESLEVMLRLFGRDFLRYSGAQVCHTLRDGRDIRLRNADGRLIFTTSGRSGRPERRVFDNLEAALCAWLAFPDEPHAG